MMRRAERRPGTGVYWLRLAAGVKRNGRWAAVAAVGRGGLAGVEEARAEADCLEAAAAAALAAVRIDLQPAIWPRLRGLARIAIKRDGRGFPASHWSVEVADGRGNAAAASGATEAAAVGLALARLAQLSHRPATARRPSAMASGGEGRRPRSGGPSAGSPAVLANMFMRPV